MDEYIKREAAVKIAEKYGLTNGAVLGRHTGLADCIASEIDSLPASDVALVVHGRWLKEEKETYCPVQYGEDGEPILHKYTCYTCSLCGRNSGTLEPYCHCGAKMDGGAGYGA